MLSTNVLNWKKEKVGTVSLPEDVFAQPVKQEVLHTVVQWQLAKRRQGTHMVKTRGLVSGGGKKPFKQKGTGSARQGSTRSPLMPGGGKLFGPQPRSYEFALPKKVRKLGLRMALSHLFGSGKLLVVADMKSETGKSAELNKRLKSFGAKKALLVDGVSDEMFKRASANLQGFKYIPSEGLNVYDLLKYDCVIVTEKSIEQIVNKCGLE